MTTIKANRIRIAGTVSGAAGQRKQRNYSQLIGDDARCSGFFSLLSGRYTYTPGVGSYDGVITQITNRKTGSALLLKEDTQAAQPSLDLDGGPVVDGITLPCMKFFTSGSDKLTLSGGTFPVAGDHFKAFIFRSAGSSSNKYLGYSGTSGNRHMLHLGSGNKVYARVGPSTNEALVNVDYTPNTWHLVISIWNAAAKRVGVSLDGGAFVTDVNASAVLDQSAFIVGGGLLNDDWITDILYGPADVSLSANIAWLQMIYKWARTKRGITLA